MEDAFQAVFVEVQFVLELGVMPLLGLIGAVGQGPAQMFGVAGKRRDRDPVLGGQITEGGAGQQGLVDVQEVFVGANFTPFIQARLLWPAPGAGQTGPAGASRDMHGRGEFSGLRN